MNHDRDSNQNCQEAGCGSADCNLYKFKARAAYDWAVETTVYVREGQQRTGIGRKLYEMLEKLLALQNIQNLNACIAYLETENEFLTHNSSIWVTGLSESFTSAAIRAGIGTIWYGWKSILADTKRIPRRSVLFVR